MLLFLAGYSLHPMPCVNCVHSFSKTNHLLRITFSTI